MAARRSRLWRYRRLLFLFGLLGFSAIAGAAYLATRLPLPSERRQVQTSFLTDATGAPLASLQSGEDRVPVTLQQVPPVVVDAVVATDDRNCFKHGGVDPFGILPPTVADLRTT